MISGVRITLRGLDPKTLRVIHATPHYKGRKVVFIEKIN